MARARSSVGVCPAQIRALVWCVAAVAGTAWAQAPLPFSDDFETGTLSTGAVPPGKWSYFEIAPGDSAVASGLAARGGAYGLRVTDSQSNEGNTPALLSRPVVRGAGSRFLRGWFRVTTSSTVGAMTLGGLWDDVSGRPFCNLDVEYPGAKLWFYVESASGSIVNVDTGATLPSGTWHLIECAILDGGTSSATALEWVDGVERVRTPINHNNVMASTIEVGEIWSSDDRFQGTIDADEVALTTTPPASHVSTSTGPPTKLAFTVQPNGAEVGQPISPSIQVSIQDSNGDTVASSSALITVAIGANPGGGSLSGVVTIAASNGVATFANLAIDRAGTGYTLSAYAASLSSATSDAFDISAPTPRLAVGCDCHAAGAGADLSLILLAASLAIRTRRARS